MPSPLKSPVVVTMRPGALGTKVAEPMTAVPCMRRTSTEPSACSNTRSALPSPFRSNRSPASGVTLFEAADAGPVPTALVALTLKVYAVPLARPATMIDAHGAAHVPVKAPGDDVAV